MSDTMRPRALGRLSGARDGSAYRFGQRFNLAREQGLLAWAATLPDEDILDMRNTGPATLRWIRDHQPPDNLTSTNDVKPSPGYTTTPDTTLGEVMKSKGWRVEIFWNSGGQWFTARMVDRDGYLVPRGDPLAASGANPDEAFAHLNDAVLEWA